MKMNQLLGFAAVGGLLYLAYKYGEKKGMENSIIPQQPLLPLKEVQPPQVSSEEECIKEIIQSIKSKPNRTKKDRDTIELLELKLKQLNNNK